MSVLQESNVVTRNAKAIVAFFVPVLLTVQQALQNNVPLKLAIPSVVISFISAVIVWAVPNKS